MVKVSFDKVVALLRERGIFAYVEQTGGGCATIYAGGVVLIGGEERYAVGVGPGWFDGPGWSNAHGDLLDLSAGPNEDSFDHRTVFFGEGDSERSVADATIAIVEALYQDEEKKVRLS